MADDPINGNGNGGTPTAPGLPGRLTELELVKAKLGITTNARDAYLNVLVMSVYTELEEINGIRLNGEQKQRLDVIDLVAERGSVQVPESWRSASPEPATASEQHVREVCGGGSRC